MTTKIYSVQKLTFLTREELFWLTVLNLWCSFINTTNQHIPTIFINTTNKHNPTKGSLQKELHKFLFAPHSNATFHASYSLTMWAICSWCLINKFNKVKIWAFLCSLSNLSVLWACLIPSNSINDRLHTPKV